MFAIDLKSKKSIYEQIVDGFKRMIMSGELGKNEKMPSVRDLAELLTVNPNTIQKAYRELEVNGWIYPVSGRGNFVSEDIPAKNEEEAEKIFREIDKLVAELELIGLSREKIAEDIKFRIEKEGNSHNDTD